MYKLLFIDGVSGAGKSVWIKNNLNTPNYEHIQFWAWFENFLIGMARKEITDNFAKEYTVIMMNEYVHNLGLGRNINMRLSDESSLLNYCNPDLYARRMLKNNQDTLIIPIHTHTVMACLEQLDKLDFDYNMIYILGNKDRIKKEWEEKDITNRIKSGEAGMYTCKLWYYPEDIIKEGLSQLAKAKYPERIKVIHNEL